MYVTANRLGQSGGCNRTEVFVAGFKTESGHREGEETLRNRLVEVHGLL